MKLLIITQKINKNDPILGFFHGWIKEFSKHFDSIVGICLEKGEYDLPANVKVLSLGKEKNNFQLSIFNYQIFKKIRYTIRFWLYIWRERNNYDAVFVHMNQEYVLLGAKLWFLMGKKVFMWRNHHAGSFLTDIAAFFCTKVFCTSKYSYTAKYKKTILMPVGIDTDLFERKDEIQRIKNSILFLGRISPVKKPDMLVDALVELKKRNIDFAASFYGDPLPKDKTYYDSLVKKVSEAGLSDKIKFFAGIPNEETVDVYNGNEIFVNLSSSGMYDKTIFEAMACECLVLASNRNLIGLIDDKFVFKEGNKEDLVKKLDILLRLNSSQIIEHADVLRGLVYNKHGLDKLSVRIFSELK